MTDHVSSYHSESTHRCHQYARKKGFELGRYLGDGRQGIVFETPFGSVVKGLLHDSDYRRERNVYLRFTANDVTEVNGFAVPRLIAFDDELMVIEIGEVSPPCVIDFASAELDHPTEFPEELMGPWRQMEADSLGDNVAEARRLSYALQQRYGIYLSDLNAGNVMFPDDDVDELE